MGLFSALFRRNHHPPLDPDSAAARRVAQVAPQLKRLAEQVPDPMEVVPDDRAAYVFIGKPPGQFGLAWIHDGRVSGLGALAEEHGLTQSELSRIFDELRDAYRHGQGAEHYRTDVEGKSVVVTPSPRLARDVQRVIERIIH